MWTSNLCEAKDELRKASSRDGRPQTNASPHTQLHHLAQCSQGNVTVVIGLIASVLFACAGIAIDYGHTVTARTHLQSLLDAATLSAIHETSIEKVRTTFDKYLESGAITSLASTSDSVEINAEVLSFDGVNLQTTATTSLPLAFAPFFGISSFPIRVNATAVKASYQEIYFAVDLSSSTGMGATDADRQALEALTQPYAAPAYGSKLPQGCAFGCHRREGWEPSGKTVYQMAREAGIKLREDELENQFNGLVDLLLDPADAAVQRGMRKVAVVGFSNYARQLAAPTSSADTVKSALDDFADSDRFESDFASVFNELGYLLGSQGDGSSAHPNKMLVMISDGIDSRDAFFSQKAMDVALCTSVKNAGFRLAVVEIKYPTLPGNALYEDTVEPVEDSISPALSACASPGWYFQAINNDDVPVKFNLLKDQIIASSTRLSR